MASLHERAQATLGDRYRIERELGRGGMATVFLAEDRKHQRLVALKVLHPDIAANIGPDRFRREIDFAAHLNHPHVLPLIDSGEDGGLFWYVMPFVEGESLRDRLNRVGRLSLAETAEIARQAASALDYAHGQGVLHRDIKPENLLLAHDHVWVADFGIARALRRAESGEVTGIFVVGTPAYMSPEQGRGDEIDGRSDLYSLATVVYEALSGATPFVGGTPGRVFHRREVELPPSIREHRSELSARAESAIHRALSRDPEERQSSAGAFAAELAGTVSSPQVIRASRRAARRSFGITLAVVGLTASIAWWLLRPPPYDDRRVVILPPSASDSATHQLGTDLVNALETQLATTHLLPVVAAPTTVAAPTGPSVEDDAKRLRATYRNRFTISIRLIQEDSLRLMIGVVDAGRLGSTPGVVVASLPRSVTAWQASLVVAQKVLPIILPTGGTIDPSLVGSRNVGALGDFLRGDRAYRQADFVLADSLFDAALAADSTFGWAALRGAQAASWRTEHGKALALISRSEPYLAALGPRVTAFAQGLRAYQEGRADQAVTSFQEALAIDPQWAEAWMALGEVYHHLLPDQDRPLERAAEAFDSARRFDPGFSPPVFHQIQHAVWAGHVGSLDSLIAVLNLSWSGVDAGEVYRSRLMQEACFGNRPSDPAERWDRFAEQYARSRRGESVPTGGSRQWELQAAIDLAGAGLRQADCATDGLKHVLRADTGAVRRQYALAALAFVEAARGQADSVARLLANPELGSYRATLSVMFAVAGLPVEAQADSFATALGETLADAPIGSASRGLVRSIWTLGAWEIHRGNLEAASRREAVLRRIGTGAIEATDGDVHRMADLLRRSLEARLTLARGDTAAALARLEVLVPTVTQIADESMQWHPWEALPHELMLRVRLLEAKGRLREAFDAATLFDSPASYGLPLYLPQSLEQRISLARRLGLRPQLRDLEGRLAALRGHGG